jgi:hypothetical protein
VQLQPAGQQRKLDAFVPLQVPIKQSAVDVQVPPFSAKQVPDESQPDPTGQFELQQNFSAEQTPRTQSPVETQDRPSKRRQLPGKLVAVAPPQPNPSGQLPCSPLVKHTSRGSR